MIKEILDKMFNSGIFNMNVNRSIIYLPSMTWIIYNDIIKNKLQSYSNLTLAFIANYILEATVTYFWKLEDNKFVSSLSKIFFPTSLGIICGASLGIISKNNPKFLDSKIWSKYANIENNDNPAFEDKIIRERVMKYSVAGGALGLLTGIGWVAKCLLEQNKSIEQVK